MKIYEEDSLNFINTVNKESIQIPLNAFGLYDYLHFIFKEVKINAGDYLVLLTDGVHNLLDRDEIKAMVEGHADDLNRAVSEMFILANKRNNFDNQSAMILSF